MQLSDHFSLAELEKSAVAARNNLDNSADEESIEYLTRVCEDIGACARTLRCSVLPVIRLSVRGPM